MEIMSPRPLIARDYLGELLQEQECEGAGRSGDRYFIHPDDQLDMPGQAPLDSRMTNINPGI